MGEFSGETLGSRERKPREQSQVERVAPQLGRVALDGTRRKEQQERVAPKLGRTALSRDEPPREERGR